MKLTVTGLTQALKQLGPAPLAMTAAIELDDTLEFELTECFARRAMAYLPSRKAGLEHGRLVRRHGGWTARKAARRLAYRTPQVDHQAVVLRCDRTGEVVRLPVA